MQVMKRRVVLVLSRFPVLILLVAVLVGLTAASITYHRSRVIAGMNEPIIAAFYNQRLHPRPLGFINPEVLFFYEHINDGAHVVEWEHEHILRPPGTSTGRIGLAEPWRREYGLWFRSIRTDRWVPRFL